MTAKKIRDRFRRTLAFEHLDRPMIDYMAERETDVRLRKALEVSTEEQLLDRLEAEFFYLPGRDISQREGFLPYYRGNPLPMNDTTRVCPFGIQYTRGAYDSKFSVDHAVKGPLETADRPSDVLNHPWPRPRDFDFTPVAAVAESQADRIRIGGLWSGILGDVVRLYGFERFLMDIALKPDVVRTLIDTVTDVYLELNDALFSILKGKLEVFFFGNDFGTQNGLLMSKEMWDEFYFGNVKKLCALAHSYGLTVMMHSCGAVAPLIPHFIDAGVDILDPVQTTATGMEPAELAASFGGSIVFHGGIDTQHVLPSASPDGVTKHVERITRDLGSRGGYIASGSQLLGPDVPTPSIIAMYRTLAVDRRC